MLHAYADGSLQSDPLLTPNLTGAYQGGSMNATFVEDPDTFGRTLECSKVPHQNLPPLFYRTSASEHCLVFLFWVFGIAPPQAVPAFASRPVRGLDASSADMYHTV